MPPDLRYGGNKKNPPLDNATGGGGYGCHTTVSLERKIVSLFPTAICIFSPFFL